MLRKIAFVLACIGVGAATAGACGGSSDTVDGSVCSAPNTQCGGTCSNTQTDPTNCGGCGTVCDSTKPLCSQGTCAVSCGGGTKLCGAVCADTQVDPANCGGCGAPCTSGQTCTAGVCGTSCGGGLTMCGDSGACVSTSSDNANCGGCGNVCGPNTTCQNSACTANLVNVGPVNVSGTLACTTGSGGSGRKTAIDDAHNLYVAMLCGGTMYVVSSQDGGLTYGTPVTTALAGTEGAIIVSSGSTPTLYAATTNLNGALFLSSSTDRGKTWATPQTLDTPIDATYNYGVTMAMYQTTLYVGVSLIENGATLHVLRDGIGAGDAGLTDVDDAGFSVSSANLVNINPEDIAIDQTNGNVWAIGEANGVYHLAVSTNGGLSFGAAVSPPGGAGFTDWVLSKGTLFGVGSADLLYAVPTATPTIDTTVKGLGATAGNDGERSIGVDANGNIYVATATNGGINIARIVASQAASDAGPADGGSEIESLRNIPEVGFGPTITANGANFALVAYTLNNRVYASSLAY